MATKKHSVEVIKPELEIDEQLPLHETGWKVQRVGWVLIVLIPVLGALGLFGEGVLSSRESTAGPYTTHYDKFYRFEKEMQIEARSTSESIAQISLPQEYIRNFRIVRIIPEPERNSAEQDQVVFHFAGSDNKLVSIYAVPERFGSISGTFMVNNQSFPLYHFIYP